MRLFLFPSSPRGISKGARTAVRPRPYAASRAAGAPQPPGAGRPRGFVFLSSRFCFSRFEVLFFSLRGFVFLASTGIVTGNTKALVPSSCPARSRGRQRQG
eukprot:scaffold12397_cov124-Isochrysis_galbana.AAC.2